MLEKDQVFVAALGASVALGAIVFRIRRRRGGSRGIATWAAGTAGSALLACAFVAFADQLLTKRASIGLERILTPIITLVAGTVVSAIIAAFVHLLDRGRPQAATVSVSREAQDIVLRAEQVVSRRRATETAPRDVSDWRTVARQAAGTE